MVSAPFLNVVVRQEDHLQPLPYHWIGIDRFADRVDQLDDQFRHVVPGRGLASEDEGPGHNVHLRVALQPLVQRQDVEDLQMLPLVLMQSLHQHVEHGCGIGRGPNAVLNVCRKLQLVMEFDRLPLFQQLRVVHHRFKSPQLV